MELVGRRTPAVRVSGIAAGLHAVLRLPARTDDGEIMAHLAARSVAVSRLRDYQAQPGGAPTLVVGYGTPPERAIEAALDAFTRGLAGAPGLGGQG